MQIDFSIDRQQHSPDATVSAVVYTLVLFLRDKNLDQHPVANNCCRMDKDNPFWFGTAPW